MNPQKSTFVKGIKILSFADDSYGDLILDMPCAIFWKNMIILMISSPSTIISASNTANIISCD